MSPREPCSIEVPWEQRTHLCSMERTEFEHVTHSETLKSKSPPTLTLQDSEDNRLGWVDGDRKLNEIIGYASLPCGRANEPDLSLKNERKLELCVNWICYIWLNWTYLEVTLRLNCQAKTALIVKRNPWCLFKVWLISAEREFNSMVKGIYWRTLNSFLVWITIEFSPFCYPIIPMLYLCYF